MRDFDSYSAYLHSLVCPPRSHVRIVVPHLIYMILRVSILLFLQEERLSL
jgi:hypothetical protein